MTTYFKTFRLSAQRAHRDSAHARDGQGLPANKMPSVCASALLLAWMSAVSACAGPYGDCYNSTCCTSGNFGCKRKMGKHFAQCRPMPQGACQEEDGWECPGWELCTEKYQPCLSSKCCKDQGFGCFRRAEAEYAQCRPLPAQGMCADTADWLCPGWELCSDASQACTATHCCSDRRFACYQKHPHYAQCMRRGTCEAGRDGDCEELNMELGQCSAPYHDCHLSACCQRGEDHCYLRTEFYGQCRPSCSVAELGSDWSCSRRELPRERSKVTCETLRTRNNIYKRTCSTQYESPDQCNRAFASQDNFYQPCTWVANANSCQESGQVLACDCALRGQNCPRHDDSQSGAASDQMSGGEGAVVVTAVLIIIAGCAGLAR